MDAAVKRSIGVRIRKKREEAGYTRERMGELCSLSPRFIANIEFGDSTVSVDSLMVICQVLSCSADSLLFGEEKSDDVWENVVDKIRHIDTRLQPEILNIIQAIVEISNK